MSAPLEGIRILDLTRAMAGPFCCMLLGDMGADVIKIEPPGGDPTRHAGTMLAPGVSAAYLAANRNKRSITLDLKQPPAVGVLERLVVTADVLVENYRPGVARRLGIDHDRLRSINPRLIYCSISGFGQRGPRANEPGYDLIAQGMSGIMSATGAPEGPPAKVGVPVTSMGAGLFGAVGILSALRARHITGRGQHVDTSLFEAGLALSAWEATEYWYTGQIPRRLGTAHRLNAPYQAFRASDGHFTVGAANSRLWPRFCELLGLESLVRDARFETVGDRVANQRELERLIEAVTVAHPRAHWLARCEAAGIPAGPINSVPEALADPHAQSRAMTQQYDYPGVGSVQTLGNPVKLSRSPARTPTRASSLGEDTATVFGELGYTPAEMDALRSQKAI